MSDQADHAAPGLVVAIIYQLKRALLSLLSSDSGDAVGLEAPWDVGIFREGRLVVAEEDKHTIGEGNPLTDRSVAWWKSLRNFTAGVVDGRLSEGCLLLLTTNAAVKQGLPFRFINGGDREDQWVSTTAAELLSVGSSPSKDIAPFVEYCNEHPVQFEQVVRHLVVLDGQCMKDEGQLTAKIWKLLRAPAHDVEYITDSLLGWMTEMINRSVLNGEAAVIQVEHFNTRYRMEITRSREQRLLRRLDEEYAAVTEAKKLAQEQAIYYEQMRWIGLHTQPATIEACVEDFLRYEIAVTAYGEDGQVPRQRFRDRERDIQSRWRFIFGQSTFGCDHAPAERCEEIGREVFSRSMQMPLVPLDGAPTESFAFLTRGALQKLADSPCECPEVGWHPHYETLCKARGRSAA